MVILPKNEADAVALVYKLLELNADGITGAAFGLRGEAVVLTAERSTRDLDKSEVLDLVKRVELYADKFDDELMQAFSAERPPPGA